MKKKFLIFGIFGLCFFLGGVSALSSSSKDTAGAVLFEDNIAFANVEPCGCADADAGYCFDGSTWFGDSRLEWPE